MTTKDVEAVARATAEALLFLGVMPLGKEAHDHIARAAIKAHTECLKWQPIETAKEDGEKILLYLSEGNIVDGWWEPKEDDGPESMGHDAGWHDEAVSTSPSRSFGNPKYYNEAINPPTHWSPRPEDPEEKTP